MSRFPLYVALGLVASLSTAARAQTEEASRWGGSSVDSPESVRTQRRFSLLGETGWNSLSGTGVVGAFNATAHVAFDVGLGLGLGGPKVGARFRFNLLTGNLTPFLGIGAMREKGLEGDLALHSDEANTPRIHVSPSTFVQAVTGLDWTAGSGFHLLFTVGYARRLTDNVNYVGGRAPTHDERDAWRIVEGSGLSTSFALGYAF